MSSILVPQLVGSKLVMMYKWDAARALALVEKEKVTSFPTVPAIMKDFLSHPDFDRYDTSSLKRVAGGGSATPQGLAELITEKLGPVSRSMGYGMTETLTAGFGMSGRLYDWKPYSGGMKAPTVDARVVDPAGRVLSRGEEGEIQLFGICNMVEYWNKPYATRAAFTTDGYLKTGDAGIIDDDDYIHITGRLKELVIRGGEKISPPEIEQVAYTIGKIQEAVVFGVDDADMGEELALVCLLSRGCTLSAAELREYLSQRLPHFKVPKHIAFSAEPLPRNASEKLHKLATKERYLAGKYVS